jgi:hypothetical protein
MRDHANRRTDRGLARMVRWLGFDRNPLRRGTDRVEAVLRLVMIIMLVAVIPATAVAAGRAAERLGIRVAGERPALERPPQLRSFTGLARPGSQPASMP